MQGGKEVVTNFENIKIRNICLNDFPAVLKWSRDGRFCIANGWDINQDEKRLLQWWEKWVNNKSDQFIRWGIDYNGSLVGYIDLVLLNGNGAEIGIAIGDSQLWSKGIGTYTLKLGIEKAEKDFGIQTFFAETHETNFASRKMLEKIGFTEISRKGEEQYLGAMTTLIQYKYSI